MQYQRKKNIIYQKEVKDNFRTNYLNYSKTNESTKEETKYLQPIKISDIPKFLKSQKYNLIQNEIQNGKQISDLTHKNIYSEISQENTISTIKVNWEKKNKIINNNDNNNSINNDNNKYNNKTYNNYKDSNNNNFNDNSRVYNNNERGMSCPKFENDKNNNRIISLKVKNIENNISYNSHLRNSSTSECNSLYQNSAIKDIRTKDDNKTNSFESLKSQNTNYNTNLIKYNNNSRINHIKYKYSQNKITKKINTNYINNYDYNNTPNQYNDVKYSYEYRKQSVENSKIISELDIDSMNSNNDSNKCVLRQKRANNMNLQYEFPYQKNIQNNTNINVNIHDNISENNININNNIPLDKQNKKFNSFTYNDLKNVQKKFNKIYDIDESGIVIKDTKVILPGASNEFFNNRKKILSKMNRLSNILLSKNRNEKESNYNSSSKKSGEKGSKSSSSKNLLIENNIKHKFLYISLHTGKNIDDKKIVRGMRNEKGGVVDLSNEISKKKKFTIIKAKKGGKSPFSKKENILKIRERSAKIIQNWYRYYRLIFINKIKQIIFIQSCWRGFWIRRHIFDLLYLSYLYSFFIKKIQIVFDNRSKSESFKKLFLYSNNYSNKKKSVIHYDKILPIINIIKMKRLIIIKEFIDKFFQSFKKENIKGKNLIRIKTAQEAKVKLLYSAFISWAYKTNVKNYNKNLEKDKIKSEPNIHIYIKKTKIKNLIGKKTNINKHLLRKYFYQWYIKTLNIKYELSFNQQNNKTVSIKLKLFILIVESIINDHNLKLLNIFYQKIYKNNKPMIKEDNVNKNKLLKNIENINEGCKVLERYIFRNTYIHPFYCIMDKINNENIDINLMKILKTKKRNQKEFLKDIFHIWKNKVYLERKNDLIKTLFIKIINIFQKCYLKELLTKKFYQWKNISNIISTKLKSINKGKSIFIICDFIKIQNIKINAKYFFCIIKNLKKRININDLKLFKKILSSINRKRQNLIIRNTFNKWNYFVIRFKIFKLKGKIIFNLYSNYKSNNNKILLLKYFNKWIYNSISQDKNKTINIYNNIEINYKQSFKQIQIIILKSILRKSNRYYTYNNLNKYFKKWANITKGQNQTLKSYSKLENLISEFPSLDTLKSRIMHKKFLDWKNKINNSKMIVIRLQRIFDINNKTKLNIINYFLKKWLFIANALKMNENGCIIVNFCKIKIKNILVKKHWHKLSNKLKNINNIKNINFIINNIKYIKGFERIGQIYKKQSIEISFKKIVKINYIHIFINKMKYNIEKINNNKNKILLKRYLFLWQNKKNKICQKENILKNMIDKLKLHSLNNYISIINTSFYSKKIINIIYKTEEIIQKNIIINKNIDTSNNTINEIIIDKKNQFMQNMHKLYFFKILDNFCNCYNKLVKKKLLIYMIKFFMILKSEIIYQKEYKYTKIIYDEKRLNNNVNIKFHFSKRNQNKTDNICYKKNIYLILMPSLFKYLNKKLFERKELVFDKIKLLSTSNKFCNIYKHFTNKNIISNKICLVNNLKNNIFIKQKNIKTKYFYEFIKKSVIHKITKILLQQGHYIKLLNLTKITMEHINISKSIWLLKIIKKWRFITFMKNLFSKKMSLMYNNLHVGYMDLVDNIINNEGPLTKNEVDKMSRLDMNKYLNNYEDPLIIKKNEKTNKVKRKYMFPPLNHNKEEENKNEEIENNNISNNISKYGISDSYDISQENNDDNDEKDISFMEKKFIKDNVNYMYVSYDESSSFYEDNK